MHPFLRMLLCALLYPLYVAGIMLLGIVMIVAYPLLLAYLLVCAITEEE